MSTYLVIKGGKRLSGTIPVYGSKNAALPIIAATILTKTPCVIRNIPRVTDVHVMIDALRDMGAKVLWKDRRTVIIENKEIDPDKLSQSAVQKMRASILFCGPLLARFGEVRKMHYPGGCSIGARPIDVHLRSFEDLGAKVIRANNFFSIYREARPRSQNSVVLNEFSVTATENVLLFASAVPEQTTIKIAAAEPHVADLAKFLTKTGARIHGAGTAQISIRGSANLIGATHRIIADYIEAGTFILMALVAGRAIEIKNAPIEHLDLVIKKLRAAGGNIACNHRKKTITVQSGRKSLILDKVQIMPYPGIPTDLQSAFGVFAARTVGETLIHEPLYENRFACLKELAKFGVRIKALDPHRAIVHGPTNLNAAEVSGHDLRSVAALVIAGLAAKGTTIVRGAEHVERGYENLEGRLLALGANIKKVTTDD